jgi:ribosome-associated translation inhibitor RaiA
MAEWKNTKELTEIKNKLKGQEFRCKTFYDNNTDEKLTLRRQNVYLSSDIKNLFELINELFEKKNEEIRKYKKKYNELEDLYISKKLLRQKL